MKPVYDVVIVGARCAGAATAMLLARHGLSVLAVDRAPYGSDTLSTHALMRGAVVQLARWGVIDDVRRAGTPLVRRASFHYGDRVVEVPIKARDGVDGLMAPRRTVLDRVLVDAARASGATVVHGARVRQLLGGPSGRISGAVVELRGGERQSIRAGVVVGADGARSTVASLVGAETYRSARHATGVVYGYFDDVPTEGYRWMFRPGAAAGAIATSHGQTCVFAGVSSARFQREMAGDLAGGFARVIREVSPPLAEQLEGRQPQERLRGFPGQPAHLRRSAGPGWALVGDAGYYKDTLTAHGITDTFRDVELLARAILAGTEAALAAYQAERDDHADGLFDLHDRIASFEWTLESLPLLHEAFSREVSREARWLGGLPPAVRGLASYAV